MISIPQNTQIYAITYADMQSKAFYTLCMHIKDIQVTTKLSNLAMSYFSKHVLANLMIGKYTCLIL